MSGLLRQNEQAVTKGYQGVITQAIFGVCANWLGEFAPDIKLVLKKSNAEDSAIK